MTRLRGLKVALLIGSSLALGGLAIAANADRSIKGVSLWQSRDDFIATHDSSGCLTRSMCSYADTLGGVQGSFVVEFSDDERVSMLGISDLDASEFNAVIAALVSKFGKPGLAKHSIVSNAMGAKFDNHIYVWRGKGWQLQAEERSNSVLKSGVEFFTEEKERELDGQAAKKKDDV